MSELRKDVKEMLENEGMYLAVDPLSPHTIAPIVSQNGKLFAMRIDLELAPGRFYDRTRIHGPFRPLFSNLLTKE
jgi:hypothetical protein